MIFANIAEACKVIAEGVTPNPSDEDFLLSGYRVRPTLHRIEGPEGLTPVEPRTMRLLLVLVANRRSVMTRQELLDAVWGDTVVAEESLTRSISDLRRSFDDDPRHPKVIETIHRRGYRLIADVQPFHPVPNSTSRSSEPAEFNSNKTRKKRRLGWAIAASLAAVGLTSTLFVERFYQSTTSHPVASSIPFPATALPGAEFGPALAPDGKHLVFGWLESGDPSQGDLYLVRAGGTTPRRLTEIPGIETAPTWSPDGREIAFLRVSSSEAEVRRCDVVGLDVASGEERQLATCESPTPSALAWSRARNTLILSDNRNGSRFQLWELPAQERQDPKPLTAPPLGTLGDRFPTVSPRGDWLAFVRASSPSTVLSALGSVSGRINVLPTEGGSPRALGPTREFLGLAWDKAGTGIYFLSPDPGVGWDLRWIDWREGIEKTIAAPRSVRRNLQSAIHTGRLVFEEWTAETDLWLSPLASLTLEERDSRRLHFAASTLWESDPAFDPTGRAVAFLSTRSGSHEIWISDPSGTNARQLTQRGHVRTGHPAWSPSGRHLAFESEEKGSSSIFVVDAATGAGIAITDAAGNDRAPSWSVDGNALYFGSNRSGSWEIWRVVLSDGTPKQVTEGGGLKGREVVVGDRALLVFSRIDEPGLWAMRIGSRPQPLAGATSLVDPMSWTVHGSTLYFLAHGPNGPLLTKLLLSSEPERSEIVSVGRIGGTGGALVPGLAVSPNGKFLLYAEHSGMTADLFYVDPPG